MISSIKIGAGLRHGCMFLFGFWWKKQRINCSCLSNGINWYTVWQVVGNSQDFTQLKLEFIPIWFSVYGANYNDLTATHPGIMVDFRGIIPQWPQISGYFRWTIIVCPDISLVTVYKPHVSGIALTYIWAGKKTPTLNVWDWFPAFDDLGLLGSPGGALTRALHHMEQGSDFVVVQWIEQTMEVGFTGFTGFTILKNDHRWIAKIIPKW